MAKYFLVGVILIAHPAVGQQRPTAPAAAEQRATKTAQSQVPNVQSGAGIVTVDPKQPYRPLPANRAQPRETIFEFYLRALNPRQTNWGVEIDRRMALLAQQSALNPYFRFSAFQMALILLLLLTCWLWWDKMQQIKRIAAECLADAINAKRIADLRALEAINQHNRHIEMCNRVIENHESGLPTGGGSDALRSELREALTHLTAERAKVTKLETDLKNREDIQRLLEGRIEQLEKTMSERQGGANAELVARLQRAEAELSNRRTPRN